MKGALWRIAAVVFLILLPELAEGQSSLLSLPTPQWGATRAEIVDLYGPPVDSSLRFLLYRRQLVYGRSEIRLEFRVEGLVRIAIGFEPGPRLSQVIPDMTTLMRGQPAQRQTPDGTLYVWQSSYSVAEYGPVPPRDPKGWVTLQITDIRMIRN